MKKQMLFKTKGMNRDLSVSAFNPEFAFENMNLRLSTNDGNTLMSWVNEKGTKELEIVLENSDGSASDTPCQINGIPIGTAILNHYLVLFVKGSRYDYIFRLKYTDDTKTKLQARVLCQSVSALLNFKIDHPLETSVSYESDLIQKVYWTDYENQPRVINICKDYGVITRENYCPFDFIQELQLKETITVKKQLGATGMFAPGVIQYSFTYYNKYGPETNIFYTTPLLYTSYQDRGASPEDKVENAFSITVNHVDDYFEYLRIYSIQRTSIDSTPIVKRVQDISTSNLDWVDPNDYDKGKKISYIDTGTSGEIIDPMELLYKGGEVIKAKTLEQKDNTLFMGNIKVEKTRIENTLKTPITSALSIGCGSRTIFPMQVSTSSYIYYNQLTSTNPDDKTVPCGGFKTGEWYRLGLQFQHKSGKWSEPIPKFDIVNDEEFDYQQTNNFSGNSNLIVLPTFKGTLSNISVGSSTLFTELLKAGYKRVRPVVVFPSMIDKSVICQAVTNPTLYTNNNRGVSGAADPTEDIYAQASWFFRPYIQNEDNYNYNTVNKPKSRDELHYTQRNIESGFPDSDLGTYNPSQIRKVEVQGDYSTDNRFRIDKNLRTLHSPDIEFDEQLELLDYTSTKYIKRGLANFTQTLSDIDIQTETPVISNKATGFVHKSFTTAGADGIISGLFYDDFVVDDHLGDDDHLGKYPNQISSAKWMVYPWQKNGSLNNDINRPSDKGIASSVLKKKMISNLRYAETDFKSYSSNGPYPFDFNPQLFNGDEHNILKLGISDTTNIYKGSIDTMVTPDHADGDYFALDSLVCMEISPTYVWVFGEKDTSFTSTAWMKTFSKSENEANQQGLRKYKMYEGNNWDYINGQIGDDFIDLDMKKSGVRMKYKSSKHLVANVPEAASVEEYPYDYGARLAIIDILNTGVTNTTRFGGKSSDALRENTWLPCGEPVELSEGAESVTVNYDYGDTYFQRYDCLKTYAYTKEDINQVVEIGSFMLESRVNIDGRYDRNRGQLNNLNMSPQNFNLINPVYSQKDNFFSYKIMDEDSYKNQSYPNLITWSKTKENGADIDAWTNVTLASVLELDGNKGEISSLQRLNNQLVCFQDSGISHILYNENVQIESTQGVPIEIANSGKVQGKRYLSDTVGCSNKWSIVNTPSGIYFMDSNEKSIYRLGEGLTNISQQGGFNTWCKKHIPASNIKWTPEGFNNFVGYYDKKNQDVLYINDETALAFSEKTNAFSSFYSYGNTPFFCNLDDIGIWLRTDGSLWKHQAGSYGRFFDEDKPYWMTLVGNPEPQTDKIFTNLEFRASVEGDGELDEKTGKFTPALSFDSLECWNEYQHGYTALENKSGHSLFKHGGDISALIRKFRIWRSDIPRNNCLLDSDRVEGTDYPYQTDEYLNLSRHIRKPQDRMRNPWLYLKLMKNATEVMSKTEIHDVVMTYFD